METHPHIKNKMNVLITGSKGFIGKNLLQKLTENSSYCVSCFDRGDSFDLLEKFVVNADIIIHLAGENRPKNIADLVVGNSDLTKKLCSIIKKSSRKPFVIFTSSIQAKLNNPYAISKRDSEEALENLSATTGAPVMIYRLPGVFGKWCKPNYNSVVATFCHNIANNLSIEINDPLKILKLVYIDDVVDSIVSNMSSLSDGLHWSNVHPEYKISIGDLSSQIKAFKNFRTNLIAEKVGTGIIRALYSTYMSYLPASKFIYDLHKHSDERGFFVELLKTPDCGQFSFFTANPGVKRGGHYHHSKTEKFCVMKGKAKFKFRNILTGENHEFIVTGGKPQVVETIPGWAHSIKNIGNDELTVMLWANEIFDLNQPDTISCEV